MSLQTFWVNFLSIEISRRQIITTVSMPTTTANSTSSHCYVYKSFFTYLLGWPKIERRVAWGRKENPTQTHYIMHAYT